MEGHKDRDLFTVKRKSKPNQHKKRKRGVDDFEGPKRKSKKKTFSESSDDNLEGLSNRMVFSDYSDDDDEKEDVNLRREFDDDNDPVHVEPITYHNLATGFVCLGCIKNITKHDLLIDLPFMVTGRVPLTCISKAYTNILKEITESTSSADEVEELLPLESLFRKGQYVVTKVDSINLEGSKHKVQLSMLPHDVNFGVTGTKLQKGMVLQCAVASVEDNGYVMETGISGVQVAFLSRSMAKGSEILGVGSTIRCVIKDVNVSEDRNTVRLKLSANPEEIISAFFNVTDTDDLSLLLPGTAVSTTISKIKKDCVQVIMGGSDGVISSLYLSTPFGHPSSYTLGQKVMPRILYITPLSKIVHLSLQKNIFSLKSSKEFLPGSIGNMKAGDEVLGQVANVSSRGVYFKTENQRAFCSKAHLTDGAPSKEYIALYFSVGSQHQLRISHYNYFDETFIVSLQKAVLKEEVAAYRPLKVGQVLTATIVRYDSNKAIVNVASQVDGEIPFLHLTNTAIKHPEKKYAVGGRVKARILLVVPEKKHLVLTCKEHLVNCTEDILSEYSKEREGTVATGFIVKVNPFGLLVSFFGGVKGFVPKFKVSHKLIKNLSDKFSVGDVVKCKIEEVMPADKKMNLSLILCDRETETSEMQIPRKDQKQLGMISTEKEKKVTEKKIDKNDDAKPAVEKKLIGKKVYENKVKGIPIKKNSKKNNNRNKENKNGNAKPAVEKKLIGKKVSGAPIKKKSIKNNSRKKENEMSVKKKKMAKEKSNEESGSKNGNSEKLQKAIEKKADGKNDIASETLCEKINVIGKKVDGKNEIKSETPKKKKKRDGNIGNESKRPKKKKKVIKGKGDEKTDNESDPPKKKKKGNKKK